MDRLPVRAADHSAGLRQCRRGVRPLRPQGADRLGPRHHHHVVRGPVHAGLRAGAAQGRARAHRHPVGGVLRPHQGHDRQPGVRAALPADHGGPVLHLHRRLPLLDLDQRALQLRAVDADHLAAARRHSAHRLHAVPAGHLGAHEESVGVADRRVPHPPREDRGLRAMSVLELLGLVMLVGMIGAIFIGFPVSFTLLFLAILFGGFGLGWEQTFNLAYLQIWGTMKDEIFPAVPLFIFMGYMTEQAGLMERLFGALRSLLASLRGALYLAVILTATIFAMATGIVGAAVTVLGIMAGPMMIKTGYDARLSAGAIAAGGTLGILIPPSIMLVVMGPVMGVPVNLLYSAAFGPGFLLAGFYIAYTLLRSFVRSKLGPPMTLEERKSAHHAMTTEMVSAPVLALGGACLVAIAYLLADWSLVLL